MIEKEAAKKIAQTIVDLSGLHTSLKAVGADYLDQDDAWRVRLAYRYGNRPVGTLDVAAATGCVIRVSSTLEQYVTARGKSLDITSNY